jgi:hypothetical protein
VVLPPAADREDREDAAVGKVTGGALPDVRVQGATVAVCPADEPVAVGIEGLDPAAGIVFYLRGLMQVWVTG